MARLNFLKPCLALLPLFWSEPLQAAEDCSSGQAPKLFAALEAQKPAAKTDPFPWPASLDWDFPASQIETARAQVNREYLDSTLFIIPANDGEARRAAEILRATGAPHVKVSEQGWGARLDRESGTPSADSLRARGIRRVVTFELPDPRPNGGLEGFYAQHGIEVEIIDHHDYPDKGILRHQSLSSLEQLAEKIRWPMSRTDQAIAANDRSYVYGLKKMSLSDEEISAVRRYDLIAQGNAPDMVDEGVRYARALIPKLPRDESGMYILKDVGQLVPFLRQELALRSPDGLVNILSYNDRRIGFSGDPRVARALLDFDFGPFGYPYTAFGKKAWDQYGGGDGEGSMFFGFKPHAMPKGERHFIPPGVMDALRRRMNEARGLPAEVSEREAAARANGRENLDRESREQVRLFHEREPRAEY